MAIRLYVKCYLNNGYTDICEVLFVLYSVLYHVFFPLGFICPQWQLNNKILSPQSGKLSLYDLLIYFICCKVTILKNYNLSDCYVKQVFWKHSSRSLIITHVLHPERIYTTDKFLYDFSPLHQDYAFHTDSMTRT